MALLVKARGDCARTGRKALYGQESLAVGLNWPSILLGFSSKRSGTCVSRLKIIAWTPNGASLPAAHSSIAVGPKVFDLLLHLVRNRDQVVTRDDLLPAVWDGRIVSDRR